MECSDLDQRPENFLLKVGDLQIFQRETTKDLIVLMALLPCSNGQPVRPETDQLEVHDE